MTKHILAVNLPIEANLICEFLVTGLWNLFIALPSSIASCLVCESAVLSPLLFIIFNLLFTMALVIKVARFLGNISMLLALIFSLQINVTAAHLDAGEQLELMNIDGTYVSQEIDGERKVWRYEAAQELASEEDVQANGAVTVRSCCAREILSQRNIVTFDLIHTSARGDRNIIIQTAISSYLTSACAYRKFIQQGAGGVLEVYNQSELLYILQRINREAVATMYYTYAARGINLEVAGRLKRVEFLKAAPISPKDIASLLSRSDFSSEARRAVLLEALQYANDLLLDGRRDEYQLLAQTIFKKCLYDKGFCIEKILLSPGLLAEDNPGLFWHACGCFKENIILFLVQNYAIAAAVIKDKALAIDLLECFAVIAPASKWFKAEYDLLCAYLIVKSLEGLEIDEASEQYAKLQQALVIYGDYQGDYRSRAVASQNRALIERKLWQVKADQGTAVPSYGLSKMGEQFFKLTSVHGLLTLIALAANRLLKTTFTACCLVTTSSVIWICMLMFNYMKYLPPKQRVRQPLKMDFVKDIIRPDISLQRFMDVL